MPPRPLAGRLGPNAAASTTGVHAGLAAAEGGAGVVPHLVSPTCAGLEQMRAEVRAPRLRGVPYLGRVRIALRGTCTRVTGSAIAPSTPNSLPECASIPQTTRVVKRLEDPRASSVDFTSMSAGNSPHEYSAICTRPREACNGELDARYPTHATIPTCPTFPRLTGRISRCAS